MFEVGNESLVTLGIKSILNFLYLNFCFNSDINFVD
jgi:hypothetical protein